ncbi:MAG TPA: hypothetical protein VGC78_12080 [Gaiellaceae bacterium]
MAVVMSMSWPTISQAEYDKAREVVGWEREPAQGGRNHIAWFEPGGGLRVVDIWESQEDFDRFANERLMPGLAQAGLLEGKGEPEVTFAPLHAHWTPDA